MAVELCSCPECGLPAEVVDGFEPGPGPWSPPAAVPSAAVPSTEMSPARAMDLVGVRCVGRHWFFGPRQRLVA